MNVFQGLGGFNALMHLKHLKSARPMMSSQCMLATMTLSKGVCGMENRKERRDGGGHKREAEWKGQPPRGP